MGRLGYRLNQIDGDIVMDMLREIHVFLNIFRKFDKIYNFDTSIRYTGYGYGSYKMWQLDAAGFDNIGGTTK